MLQLNTNYKYFASIRDPIEILNKYRSRNFGTILNNIEKINMLYYNTTNLPDNKWFNMFSLNVINNKNKNYKNLLEIIFGPKQLTSDIFKPSKFFEGIDDDSFTNNYLGTAPTFDMAFESIISQNNSYFSKLKCINNSGHIQKFKKEYVKLIYDYYNDI
jgi:hypothetical protein